jgi:hypothetical protein
MILQNMTLRMNVNSKLRRWAAALAFACAAAVMSAAPALAQEEAPKHDARLDGYSASSVAIPNDSTALIWLLFIFLGVVALASLFKDAKRTHLD